MPRFPDSASHLHAIPAAAYSALAGRLARHPGETYPLHVGDTWMEPAERCRMEDLTVAAHPGMHRYAPVQGLPALVDAVLEREQAGARAWRRRRVLFAFARARRQRAGKRRAENKRQEGKLPANH